MTRNTVATLHEIACRSCGDTFRDHNRNRAYCANSCRTMLMLSKLLQCPICGADESRGQEHVAAIRAAGSINAATRAFADRHQPCRRRAWEQTPELERERDLACRCNVCRAEAGVDPMQSLLKTPRKRKSRPTGYRKYANEVHSRDKYICQICGLPTEPHAHTVDDSYPTLDHVIPAAEGGSDDPENLRTAHRWCNIMRNGHPIFGPRDDETIRQMAQGVFGHLLP